MKCVITGLETNNKWKGKPIHKIVMDAAKRDRLPGEGFRESLIRTRDNVRIAINNSKDQSYKGYIIAIAEALGIK